MIVLKEMTNLEIKEKLRANISYDYILKCVYCGRQKWNRSFVVVVVGWKYIQWVSLEINSNGINQLDES